MKNTPLNTTRKIIARRVPTAIALVLSGAAASVLAQSGALEEVIVTAQKRSESMQEVPISVAVFGSESMRELSVTQVKDLVKFTPGLTMSNGPSGGNDAFFYIRGIGQFDHNASADPGVGIYIDEVYLGRVAGAAVDLLDIERVEVLRGPQGTLFGRNTIGGAVSVVTARPGDEFGGNLRVTVGERERQELAGRVDLPLGDSVKAMVVGQWRQQDGWGERVYDSATFSEVNSDALRAKLDWKVAENLDVLFSVDYTDTDGSSGSQTRLAAFNGAANGGTSPLGVPFAPDMGQEMSNDLYDNFTSIEPAYDTEVNGYSMVVNWQGEALSVKSITAYRELDQFVTNDFDGGRYSFYDNYFDTDQDQFSQEFQFTGSAMSERLNWLLGLYYYEEDVDYVNAIAMGTNNGLPPFDPNYAVNKLDGRAIWNIQGFELEVESQAVFAQVDFSITDALTLTAGVRYSDEEKKQAFNFYVDNTDGVFTFANFAGLFLPGTITPTLSPDNPFVGVPTTYSDTWNSTDPKLSLEWQLTDEVLLYTSYATGFKSGGWNGRPTPNAAGQFGVVPTYDPEEVETYEVGIKSQWLDNRLRLNVTAYTSDYTDIQMLVLGPSGFFENINAGEADIDGFEMDLIALPLPQLQLTAGVGYIDAQYTKLAPGAIGSGITRGNALPNTPEYTASASAQYTFDLRNNGALSLRADYAWQDEVYFGASNAQFEYQDSYGLWNLRASWRSADESLEVAVFLLNAADKEYLVSGQDVLGPLGVAFNQVGPPQEWGAQINYWF
ncbi:MAG: TonB-dependent receptor [Halioglobus sp.]|nr:TonB-dependent receptor [Halioglobus sp.]